MRQEKWSDILGYVGIYSISTYGHVKRLTSGRILSPVVGNHGYPSVFLYMDGSRKQKLIHRIVLEAFVGSCPKGMECCHDDGNRQNPRLDNLRWDTRSSNTLDSVKQDTHADARGSLSANSKLTECDVKRIKCLLSKGHLNQQDIGKLFDVSSTLIHYIKTKKRWKHM